MKMKMKLTKVLTGMMAILVAGSMTAGCAGKPQIQAPAETQTSAPADAPQPVATELKAVNLTFATQDVGTSMYVYASALTQLFEGQLPPGSSVDVTTTSPGGVGAPIIVENGDTDVTLGNAAPAKWSGEEGILGNPPTTKVRAIAGGLSRDFINVLFTQDFVNKTGITTIEELVEKQYPVRIAVKSSGAFGEMACSKVLEVLGVDYDTVKSWGGTVTQTGSDAIVSLLKDSKADMTIDHLASGQAATTELCMTTNMFFPQMSAETIAKLNEVGFNNVEIAPGTWKGQDTAIQSVGSPQVVLVSADVPDDIVYLMTKAIAEGKERLVTASSALSVFEPSKAWEPLNCGAELHPGAKRYYTEMGYIK